MYIDSSTDKFQSRLKLSLLIRDVVLLEDGHQATAAPSVPALQTSMGSTVFVYAKLLGYFGEATTYWVWFAVHGSMNEWCFAQH